MWCSVLYGLRLSNVRRSGGEGLMAESKLKSLLAVARGLWEQTLNGTEQNMVHLATQRFSECGVVYGRHQSV